MVDVERLRDVKSVDIGVMIRACLADWMLLLLLLFLLLLLLLLWSFEMDDYNFDVETITVGGSTL